MLVEYRKLNNKTIDTFLQKTSETEIFGSLNRNSYRLTFSDAVSGMKSKLSANGEPIKTNVQVLFCPNFRQRILGIYSKSVHDEKML